MEQRNLDKALDIVSKLLMGEEISERAVMPHFIRNTIITVKCMT